MGKRGQRVIRQKIVYEQPKKAKKAVNWGQVIAGILITIIGLFLLFVAGVMFLMGH